MRMATRDPPLGMDLNAGISVVTLTHYGISRARGFPKVCSANYRLLRLARSWIAADDIHDAAVAGLIAPSWRDWTADGVVVWGVAPALARARTVGGSGRGRCSWPGWRARHAVVAEAARRAASARSSSTATAAATRAAPSAITVICQPAMPPTVTTGTAGAAGVPA